MLTAAYCLNVLILLPVCASLPGGTAAFENKVPDSPGLRWLVASLWGSVLVCSLLGLIWPRQFLFLLVFQVIYKAIYLACYLLPTYRRSGLSALPLGVSVSFLFIVLVYPWIVLGHLLH